MRLWSLHPRHLDRIGLVALWREALLAQAVLAGRTRGYRAHPQLECFRAADAPLEAIGAYLAPLQTEASARGYRFDAAKIDRAPADGGTGPVLPVGDGQLAFERAHLLAKLEVRSPADAARLASTETTAHPLFRVAPGEIASWERGSRA